MNSFKDLNIPIVLDTSTNDLIREFFTPVLTHALKYDRGVGYFSSGWLRINSVGMSIFAENGGYARWITSPILDEDDWKALITGHQAKDDIIASALLRSSIPNIKEGLEKDTLSTLAWLIADKIIEFKIALPRNLLERGEFHDKFGIFYDENGDSISFSGSYNDSVKGTYNYESIKVFKSWISEYSDIVLFEQLRFNNLWENNDQNLQVFDLPSAAKEEIIKLKHHERPYRTKNTSQIDLLRKTKAPRIPENIKLRGYQQEAIQAWISNNYHGIFEMATGSGKTITALASAIELSKNLSKLALIIVCPLQHLVTQWDEEARKFGYFPILAFDSKNKWFDQLSNKILAFNHEDINYLTIITTYDTFFSDSFQEMMSRMIGPVLIVGDEVHHVGSKKRLINLPKYPQYRLGLSATPTRWFDDDGTKGILDYFGDIVYEFSLSRAIENGFLTPYYYYPRTVELTPSEIVQYENLSKKISVQFNIGEDPDENENLLKLLIKRAEIIQTAENKIPVTLDIVKSIQNLSHTLFYCAPNQIDELTRILGKSCQLRVHQFTYRENHSLRKNLLLNFNEGILQALLAIKCLDEGVDIPSTKTAIFLSSSSNPREFIQRRGRILRKYPGKSHAEIYDLIVIPPISCVEDSNIERNIFKRELQRFKEFAESSKNFNSAYDVIWEISNIFGIIDL